MRAAFPSRNPGGHMKTAAMSYCAVLAMLMSLSATINAQTPPPSPSTPNPGLTTVGVIPVPIWTPTGATSASFDLFSFNPITRVLYQADWRNHGALAIDTVTNTFQAIINPP